MIEANRKPSREQIENRAYELYLERGAQDGDDLTDWLRAENELTEMLTETKAQPISAASTRTSKREVAAA